MTPDFVEKGTTSPNDKKVLRSILTVTSQLTISHKYYPSKSVRNTPQNTLRNLRTRQLYQTQIKKHKFNCVIKIERFLKESQHILALRHTITLTLQGVLSSPQIHNFKFRISKNKHPNSSKQAQEHLAPL